MQPEKIMEIILGTTDYNTVAAMFVLALAGMFISLLMQAVNRNPDSKRTPYRFSWKFLFSDNVLRLFVSVLLIGVFLRFSQEIFGMQVNPYGALITGFGFDKLSRIITNKKENFLNKG